jgi:hypothetical protein
MGLPRPAERRDVDGESGWRRLVEIAAIVPALAAFVWACYAALMALMVVTADDFPQCSSIHPDKAALTLLTLVIVALVAAALVLVVRRRTFIAYGCVLAQVPLALAWMEVDGGAAGCLIG